MFSKKKGSKGHKHKNVNFEFPLTNQSEGDDCVPGFYLGSTGSMGHLYNNPLPWHSNSKDTSSYSHEEVDKIITPTDRFENLLTDDCVEKTPDVFVSIDTHHFDEDDYRNHRHRLYPHMHQPLKSMEPRVLRKIKEKIRENKSLQIKAATAGVPTSVPQLLASSSDSRVIIDSSADGRVISGPVLSVVPSEESDEAEKSDIIEEILPTIVSNTPESAISIKSNRKRKKRKKRIKKQEPFHPTLGKVSEESNSPLLSGTEEFIRLETNDDDEEYEEDFDDNLLNEAGGLVLEELYNVVNSDKPNSSDLLMDSEQNRNILYSFDNDNVDGSSVGKHRKISFLEEIASTDYPIGFLDMTLRTQYTRKHSLPAFINLDPNITPSISSLVKECEIVSDLKAKDLGSSKSASEFHPKPIIIMPTTLIVPEEEEETTDVNIGELGLLTTDDNLFNINGTSRINGTDNDTLELIPHPHQITSTTHLHPHHHSSFIGDDEAAALCHNQPPHVSSSSMTRLPSSATSAATNTENYHTPPLQPQKLTMPSCNFQIGSTDSVINSGIDSGTNFVGTTTPKHITGSNSSSASSHSSNTAKSHHHHHHHHHHHREHYNKRDLEKRTFSGQDMRSLWQSNDLDELDEYQSTMLGDAIIDDMKSHRCYDMPALNRTRFRNRYMHSHSKNLIQRSRSVTHTHTPNNNEKERRETIKKCITCSDDNYRIPHYTKSQEDLIFQTNVSHTDLKSNETQEDDPLPLFVEMDILKPNKYWREVSRWVRYEQVYNEYSDTFGKAHSSPLKFTAFTQFRVQMEDALFLPNVEATTLSDAIALLTEELLVAQLFTEPRESYYIKEAFRFRHLHAGEKTVHEHWDDYITTPITAVHSENYVQSWTDSVPGHVDLVDSLKPNITLPGNLNNSVKTGPLTSGGFNFKVSAAHSDSPPPIKYPDSQPTGSSASCLHPASATTSYGHKSSNQNQGHSNVPFVLKVLKNSIPLKLHGKHQHKSDLEGHLPLKTEAVCVQVGEIHALHKPFLAILRLKNPLKSDQITEINVPIRFLIICLGPPAKLQYEEVGRVISTMMINKDFRKMMYRATDKYEIIDGLYKYLDTCFVLSYSDRHSARNMHTMVDHIHDFMRVPSSSGFNKSFGKDHDYAISHNRTFDKFYSAAEVEETARLLSHEEGIKHSASVNWADEQKPLLVKQRDLTNSHDMELGDMEGQISECESQQKGYGMDHTISSASPGLDNEGDLIADGKFVEPSKVTFKMDSCEANDSVCLKNRRNKMASSFSFNCCYRILYFLFRLLRLDWMMYRKRILSDFTDAFHKDNIVIVLCGLLYLYFVCLSPALTFGALLGNLVSKQFSVQSVLACNGCLLILFALLAGNPMVVIGMTGPMFLMESVIGNMADSFSIDIMLYRLLISLYLASLGLLSLACNITWIMQKVRRSVEECFNAFIGLYFVFKAVLTIFQIFSINDPTNNASNKPTNSSNISDQNKYLFENRIAIGFASLVLAYSMYQICVALNSVKRGRFFTRKFRKMVDYFNVAIGILVLSFVNVMIIKCIGISLPTLKADVTDSTWFRVPHFKNLIQIDPVPNIIAFFLAFALLSLSFTETAIAGISVTKAERKLIKPSLFAQDQFVCLCILPVISGSLGWPFLCGAAVRSTSYVISMTKWDQKVVPGVRHKIIGVVEQRITLIIVGILVLATVFVESILKFIPVSAMLGMFLYMGVMAIRDLVVTRRLISMFKRCKHWKDHDYLKDIPPNILRGFEILQLILISLMFTMNCITEFCGITWTTFLIPVILLGYALCREIFMPRLQWLAPYLDKLDPRHLIHVSRLCPVSTKQYDQHYTHHHYLKHHQRNRHQSPSSVSLPPLSSSQHPVSVGADNTQLSSSKSDPSISGEPDEVAGIGENAAILMMKLGKGYKQRNELSEDNSISNLEDYDENFGSVSSDSSSSNSGSHSEDEILANQL